MSEEKSKELRVSVDVGYRRHSVAIGLPSGEILEEFEIEHRLEGFQEFFSRIEKHNHNKGYSVAVAMEGYNGYARPLDSLVRQRGYRLYNINNLKLARFKEIFPGSAKSDRIDARKGLELFQLREHLPLAKEVLQEVSGTPQHNEVLKRLWGSLGTLLTSWTNSLNTLLSDWHHWAFLQGNRVESAFSFRLGFAPPGEGPKSGQVCQSPGTCVRLAQVH